MKYNITFCILMIFILAGACKNEKEGFRAISSEVLKDKIAGGWAGKMIGVT